MAVIPFIKILNTKHEIYANVGASSVGDKKYWQYL